MLSSLKESEEVEEIVGKGDKKKEGSSAWAHLKNGNLTGKRERSLSTRKKEFGI